MRLQLQAPDWPAPPFSSSKPIFAGWPSQVSSLAMTSLSLGAPGRKGVADPGHAVSALASPGAFPPSLGGVRAVLCRLEVGAHEAGEEGTLVALQIARCGPSQRV